MTETLRWPNMERKLVAILRGIQTSEVPGVVSGLIEAGFRAIEIPLNSPDPFRSIEAAVRSGESQAKGACLIGAGTVLSAAEVGQVKDCGGNLIVSPNVTPAVIAETVTAGMAGMPGVFTASEAHQALASGATTLKFFPASILGAAGIRAIDAILPKETEICAVGGIEPKDFADYIAAGIRGFGLGSGLYRPGATAADVARKARSAVEAYDRVANSQSQSQRSRPNQGR